MFSFESTDLSEAEAWPTIFFTNLLGDRYTRGFWTMYMPKGDIDGLMGDLDMRGLPIKQTLKTANITDFMRMSQE